MGRSAKVHKRTQKKVTSSTTSSAAAAVLPKASSSANTQVQTAKKRAGLKEKGSAVRKSTASNRDKVLGEADYVSLLLGSRTKARQEAQRLPKG